MICFDVYVNGEKVCRAGKEEISVMACHVAFIRQSEHYEKDELGLSVSGLFRRPGEKVHPQWIERLNLTPGDEVSIRIVEADEVDRPTTEFVYSEEDELQQQRAYFEVARKKLFGDKSE